MSAAIILSPPILYFERFIETDFQLVPRSDVKYRSPDFVRTYPSFADRIASVGFEFGLALDYGVVIVHIFYPDTRDFYDLEHLWADATPVEIEF